MNPDLFTKIYIIESKIQREDYNEEAKKVREWGGADVIISQKKNPEITRWLGENSLVINLEEYQPKKRAVITKHSKELTWLFLQFQDIFSNYIDYINKYELYGRLAYYAQKYTAKYPDEKEPKELLNYVFTNIIRFLDK